MDLAMAMTSLSTIQLQNAVGIELLNSVKEMQKTQANSLLQDFAGTQRQIQQASHPFLGKRLDVYV